MYLYYLSDEQKNDDELVQIAVAKNPGAIRYASERIMLQKLKEDLTLLESVGPCQNDFLEKIKKSPKDFLESNPIFMMQLRKSTLIPEDSKEAIRKKMTEPFLETQEPTTYQAFADHLSKLTEEDNEDLHIQGIQNYMIRELLQSQNPDIQDFMIQNFLQLNKEQIKDIFAKIAPHLKTEPTSVTNASKKILPLFAIYASKAPNDIKQALAERFLEHSKMFKDSFKRQPLVLLLKELYVAQSPENYKILSWALTVDKSLLRDAKESELKKRIDFLTFLFRTDPAKFSQLEKEKVNSKDLSSFILEPLIKNGFIAQDTTDLQQTEITSKLFSFRNGSAFFTYVSRFKGNTEMTKAIQTMIDWIGKNQFTERRHENNRHNQHLSKPQKEKWEESIPKVSINRKGKELTIVDTEDAEDLFLCGTEVDGSCQRVDAYANLNKCLMGYVLDGKIRLIAVKDDKGKIISRAIIKLLLTEDNKPALFFEKIYGGNAYEKDLKSLAKAKAKSMGVSIYESQPGGIILHSEGSPAPFEYEDGGIGVAIGGIYRVHAMYLLMSDN